MRIRRGLLLRVFLLITPLMLMACEQGVHSTRGFRLPEGDVEQGALVFQKYECSLCHQVEGVEDSGREKLINPPVVIGGPVSLNKTYADLVTSVINPSHRISRELDQDVVQQGGQSVMPSFNDVMTVTELVNLVTFLETKYELVSARDAR